MEIKLTIKCSWFIYVFVFNAKQLIVRYLTLTLGYFMFYRPIAVLDIDDTLFKNTVITDTLNELNLGHIKRHYDLSKMDIPSYVAELINKRFNDPTIMGSFNPIAGAKEFVDELIQLGYKPICVTARAESTIGKATLDMVLRHIPKIEEVWFTDGKSKRPLVDSLNASIIVDDNAFAIKDCIGSKAKLFMVSNEHTPHNYDHAVEFKLDKRVKVITHLHETIPHI